MLPNLIVIGAQKAGTTSLHRYLDLHPEVFMSNPKELDFFLGPGRWNWDRGLDWYESHFDSTETVRGESSPHYTFFPYFPGVPERIRSIVPEAKLIYIVRDPVERMVSEYIHYVADGHESRSISEVFSDDRFYGSGYVVKSKYQMQIEEYLQHFPASSLLVLAHEDLLFERRRTLARTFRFLGVDERFESPDFTRLHNTTRAPRLQRWLRRGAGRSLRPRVLQSRASGLLGKHALERLVLERGGRPALEPGLRERLAGYVSEDADRLRRFTGQRFDRWSV